MVLNEHECIVKCLIVLTQGNTYDVGLFQHLDTSEMLIRGMNVLVLNEVTGSIMSSRWFDTYESQDDSGFLLDYIQGLRLGRIICFAIKVSKLGWPEKTANMSQ